MEARWAQLILRSTVTLFLSLTINSFSLYWADSLGKINSAHFLDKGVDVPDIDDLGYTTALLDVSNWY